MASTDEDFRAPDAAFVRRHWVPSQTTEWAEQANAILLENGAVQGQTLYQKRHVARWRARRLIQLMIELGMHDREQLREHVELKPGGWRWTVEYTGGHRYG